jgi:uncharacterized protein YbjT (DUF2867 family)
MRVLVTGAYGFIGAHIVAGLGAAGHEVVCAVRGGRVDSRFPGLSAIACDMADDVHVEDWLPRLKGIDAVVNSAGILRKRANDRFTAVHEQGPLALFRACEQLGIRRVIQISALGAASDGEFIASKHRSDATLATLELDWLVLRPSLVYSVRGSYGGTSLLRGLAALPGVLLLPGKGEQQVQPIAAEDIGQAVVAALARPAFAREFVELVGPEVLTLRDYLFAWRGWLGFGPARTLAVPGWLVRIGATLGEHLGSGPLGQTMARMLERGNVGGVHASTRLQESLGLTPRSLLRALTETPSEVQDRWHARLYFSLPVLRVSIALLWMGSGLAGWLVSAAEVVAVVPGGSLSTANLLVLARVTATADLVLGVLLLLRWRSRLVLTLMLLMLLGYTLGIGIGWPSHWLDPLGGLLKNLPLFAVLLVLLATDERR